MPVLLSMAAGKWRGRGYDFPKMAEVDLICNSDWGRPISENGSPDPCVRGQDFNSVARIVYNLRGDA